MPDPPPTEARLVSEWLVILRLYASRLVLGKEKEEDNLVPTFQWKRNLTKVDRSVMRDFWLENRRRWIQ